MLIEPLRIGRAKAAEKLLAKFADDSKLKELIDKALDGNPSPFRQAYCDDVCPHCKQDTEEHWRSDFHSDFYNAAYSVINAEQKEFRLAKLAA